jgi:hypothetical protein
MSSFTPSFSSEEFRKGFRSAITCISDMIKYKYPEYTIPDLIAELEIILRIQTLVGKTLVGKEEKDDINRRQ